MKKALVMVLVMTMVVFALSACATTKQADEKADEITIGFSVYDMQYEFFQDMEQGTSEAVKGLGYKYLLHDEMSDETEMVTGAKNLIDQGVAALIISPIKPDALNSIVEYAHEKNVPVVVDDIGGGDSNYDLKTKKPINKVSLVSSILIKAMFQSRLFKSSKKNYLNLKISLLQKILLSFTLQTIKKSLRVS
jgi:ABC-type xylose transport system substrate-binding protein